jgi:hypothetical protein
VDQILLLDDMVEINKHFLEAGRAPNVCTELECLTSQTVGNSLSAH